MDVLSEVSPPAQRLYTVMAQVAEHGICKANQRQLTALLGMAFKTLIPARDELVRAGLIDRIHHYRGKRDWYRIVAATRVERTRETVERQERAHERALSARRELMVQPSLFASSGPSRR